MCGIFGLIGERENIEDCLEVLRHRGPDDKGLYFSKEIILGFRRLKIIDLSEKGHQPMTNEKSDVWIVFNGEIYNFKELKALLEKKHRFISHTDTEVLIHGYEEWGVKGLLQKINGMFAFCIYDSRKNICYLSRDRIGEKPLYIYKFNDSIAFSSEVKAFFFLKDFKFNIDEEMLNLYFGFPFIPDNQKTIIEGVSKIPPGTYIEIQLAEKKEKSCRYYKNDAGFKLNNDDDSSNQLEQLLIRSIKERLIADVPVGILLSGGLDSSLITAIASKYSSNKIKTITISFPKSCIDERNYAHIVSKFCKTDHTDLEIDYKNTYDMFKKNIGIYDDLSTTDSGLFSTYLMSQSIKNFGVKVVLTGEGADEIFAGYSWYWLSGFPFNLIPDNLRTRLYYYAIMRIFSNGKYNKYHQYMNNILKNYKGSYFERMQQFEINYSLPNHYCMKLDKGCSAASIEARPPFMDYRIIDYVKSLSKSKFLKYNFSGETFLKNKYILREIAKKYLPKEIYLRPKKGGMFPVYDMIDQGIKKDRGMIINNRYLQNFFGSDYLNKLINARPRVKPLIWQREWILWKVLVFSLWHSYYSNYGKR